MNIDFLEHGQRLALSDGHTNLSYEQLSTAIEQAAQMLLSLNVEIVALGAQNSIDWVVVELACQAADIVCLPLPDFFTPEQVQHCLQQANADLFLSDTDDLLEQINADAASKFSLLSFTAWQLNTKQKSDQPYPDGTQKITFTSGSTGTPKGVCLSVNHQWRVAHSLSDVIALEAPTHLCLLPLSTLLENVAGVYAPLLRGGTVIVVNDRDRGLSGSSGLDLPELLQCISQHQPHSLILLPQLLSALISACQQGWQAPDSLKFVAVGGAKVASTLIHQAREYELPVYEGYGLSECGSVVSLNVPRADCPGSAGRSLPHCRIRIEQGEIIVSGSSFLGYLNQPDSWYKNDVATGDLGRINQDGHLQIEGRRKNLIINGFGRNISPEWVETELLARPLLSDCVIVGEAAAHLSAIVGAAENITDRMIDNWIDQVNKNLPDYARVKSWTRLKQDRWPALLTANGRPKRDLFASEGSIFRGCHRLDF